MGCNICNTNTNSDRPEMLGTHNWLDDLPDTSGNEPMKGNIMNVGNLDQKLFAKPVITNMSRKHYRRPRENPILDNLYQK